MLVGAHSVVQLVMRRTVDDPVCSLLHGIVRRLVWCLVALHSVQQLAVHGVMAETVHTSVQSPVRQPLHDIVYAFVHGKVCSTKGFNDALMHSVVH